MQTIISLRIYTLHTYHTRTLWNPVKIYVHKILMKVNSSSRKTKQKEKKNRKKNEAKLTRF